MDLQWLLLFPLLLTLQSKQAFFLMQYVWLQNEYEAKVRRRRQQFCRSRARRSWLFSSLQREMRFRLVSMAVADGSVTDRNIYRRDRSQGSVFWYRTVANFSNEEWRQHFRMSKETFNFLAHELRPVLEKQTTNFGKPIDQRRRLAAIIWWLATPSDYRSISTLFGIGISTLCVTAREVCHGINTILLDRYISIPQGDRLDQVIEGFERRGFPQCAGAIDGTHLPVIAPVEKPADYHNRKGWHSIVLQAVVDHNYCFTDVFTGWPGRTHDARVLAFSDIFALAERHQGGLLFPPEKSRVINGIEVPVCIIGDPAYPLKKWLMKGFVNNNNVTQQQQRFNFRLSSARMVVENAFGRLKGRWRRLLKRNDVDTMFATDVITACCVLHNICEIHKDVYDEAWDQQRAAEEAAEGLRQPGIIQDVEANASAVEIRNAIMRDL